MSSYLARISAKCSGSANDFDFLLLELSLSICILAKPLVLLRVKTERQAGKQTRVERNNHVSSPCCLLPPSLSLSKSKDMA
jgi:hypothetical protein